MACCNDIKKIIPKRIAFLFLLIAVTIGFLIFFNQEDQSKYSEEASVLKAEKIAIISFAGKEVRAEVAETSFAKYRGLSGRESLCDDCGMLFVFSERTWQSFVMRAMKFPLDIIFIADGKVLNIAADCPVFDENGDENRELYYSDGPVDYVLEVKANWSEEHGLLPGDEVLLRFDYQ